MECPNCGESVDDGWGFCPACGGGLRRRKGPLFFRDIGSGDFFGEFDELEKMMQKMMGGSRPMFNRSFEAHDIRPFFSKPHASGYRIDISQQSGKPPKVQVRTFGDVNEKEIVDRVRKQFGPQQPVMEAPAEHEKKTVRRAPPKKTEEPKTDIQKSGKGVVVTMDLPDVSTEKDIELSALESSIEVKAFAKDKAYFKILSVPTGSRVVKKEFKKGKLTLEIVK